MNIVIGKKLGEIAGKLHLYDFCSKIGIEAFFYRITYKNSLIETRAFYEKPENKKRIKNTIDMFEDRESASIYLKAILFRKLHTLRTRPPKCKEDEYFNSLTNVLTEDEVFVDCGGYTGDTVESWCEFVNYKYKKIVVFEPDKENFKKMQEKLDGYENCTIYNTGVWSKNETLSFCDGNLAGSRVSKIGGVTGNTYIETVALDSTEECKNATFIKMDIEGSELNALIGAKNIIQNSRPILTICIYHTDEDMLSIPEWMRNNLTDYKYFCRHHAYFKEDTIIYAIPKERYKQ